MIHYLTIQTLALFSLAVFLLGPWIGLWAGTILEARYPVLPPLVSCEDCGKLVRTWAKLPLCPACVQNRKRPWENQRRIGRDDIPY